MVSLIFLVCKFKAHKRCAVRATNNCKWTTLASIGKDIIEDEDGVSRVLSLISSQYLFSLIGCAVGNNDTFGWEYLLLVLNGRVWVIMSFYFQLDPSWFL